MGHSLLGGLRSSAHGLATSHELTCSDIFSQVGVGSNLMHKNGLMFTYLFLVLVLHVPISAFSHYLHYSFVPSSQNHTFILCLKGDILVMGLRL